MGKPVDLEAVRDARKALIKVVAKKKSRQQTPPKNQHDTSGTNRSESDSEPEAKSILAAFAMTEDGLFYKPPSEKPRFKLTGPFDVLAESRPEDASVGWGLLLRWRNRDGEVVQWVMPRSMLAGDATEVRARLADGGLFISGRNDAPQALRSYLMEVRSLERARTVPRCGWYDAAAIGAAFVLPERTLGDVPGERLVLDISPAPKLYRTSGSLNGWRRSVGELAEGNTRLVFAICVGLAAPLLALTGEESGGVHLRGGSSQGKTTVAKAAASLYGAPSGPRSYVRQWRATDNGLEGMACEHADALLVLDEIGQADPRVVGASAYMLAGGQGKGRGRAAGGLRDTLSWRLLFLSTGEMSLSDFIARASGGGIKAGQELRFLDLPIEAGAGFGAFETVATKQDAEALAGELQRAAAAHHGWAGPAFIEWIAGRAGADPDWVPSRWRTSLAAFRASYLPAGSDGQVERAMRRFALAAFAGELASEAGIVPWERAEAERAARACFLAWLYQRGTHGAREDQQVAEALRLFLQLHGRSRFETIGMQTDAPEGHRLADGPRVNDRAGWRRPVTDNMDAEPRWQYGISPEVFAAEICQPLGVQPREARKMLARLNLIRTEKRGNETAVRYELRWNVPGVGRHVSLVTVDADRVHGESE